jgi:hypothetical protein
MNQVTSKNIYRREEMDLFGFLNEALPVIAVLANFATLIGFVLILYNQFFGK